MTMTAMLRKSSRSSYTFPNGNKYYGPLQDGLPHGQGLVLRNKKLQYLGEFQQGKAHGRGIRVYDDGSRYQGEFFQDKAHGRGTKQFKNGGIYKGDCRNNQFHGSGKFEWPDGTKYEGHYVEDKKHGLGTMVWSDGTRYEGFWNKDRRHGVGVETNARGHVVHDGKWHHDKPCKAKNDVRTIHFEASCCICLERYADGKELAATACQHTFHKECLDRWLTDGHSTCPRCRTGGLHLADFEEEECNNVVPHTSRDAIGNASSPPNVRTTPTENMTMELTTSMSNTTRFWTRVLPIRRSQSVKG